MPYRCRKNVITFTIITNELAQAERAEMLARAERAEILSVAGVSLPA
jgi:hypothetical protein